MDFAIITPIPRPITPIRFHQRSAVMGVTPDRPIIFAVPIVFQKKGIAKNSCSQTDQENMANFHKLDFTRYCRFSVKIKHRLTLEIIGIPLTPRPLTGSHEG